MSAKRAHSSRVRPFFLDSEIQGQATSTSSTILFFMDYSVPNASMVTRVKPLSWITRRMQ